MRVVDMKKNLMKQDEGGVLSSCRNRWVNKDLRFACRMNYELRV